MALFSYRCPDDGSFDLRLPIGTAGSSAACPWCGSDAVRVYTAPMIATGNPVRSALIERCEKSRSEPDVVTSIPDTGRRRSGATSTPASRNPAWSRLPRP